jgi:hypothetical protein
MYHEEDFGLKAEWHFHATSHGKGPCDGIGAILKREARRASLQITNGRPILTPQDLYDWAKQTLRKTDVFFVSKVDHGTVKQKLASRYSQAKTISSTHKMHSFVPIPGKKELMIKTFSNASTHFTFPPKKAFKKVKKNTTRQNIKAKPEKERMTKKKVNGKKKIVKNNGNNTRT